MMQQTTINAYTSIRRTLGCRQSQVYKALLNLAFLYPSENGFTDRELSKYLSRSINQITPRRNELVSMGFVAKVGVKRDIETGCKAILWKALEVY
jgi:predicted transcriptional regulator